MPLIKPRTERTVCVRHITQLYVENQEELYAYATFIKEPTAYVLNALIDTLKKDAEFRAWRAEHPESCIPPSHGSRRGAAPKSVRSSAAHRAGITPLPAV